MDLMTYALCKGNGGGSGLPSVTSSDNGKVLAVSNGAWGAGSPFVVVTVSNNEASLKGSEINSLVSNGISVVIHDSDGYYAYQGPSGTSAMFCGVSSGIEAKRVSVNDSKGVSRLSKSVYSKPSAGIPETDFAQAVKDKLNKFIVTITPTAEDFSGTMDKTPAEITAAYEAGQDIVFDIPSLSVSCKAMEFVVGDGIIQAGAIVTYRMDSSNLLIEILTNNITSGYETHIYSLTPLS